ALQPGALRAAARSSALRVPRRVRGPGPGVPADPAVPKGAPGALRGPREGGGVRGCGAQQLRMRVHQWSRCSDHRCRPGVRASQQQLLLQQQPLRAAGAAALHRLARGRRGLRVQQRLFAGEGPGVHSLPLQTSGPLQQEALRLRRRGPQLLPHCSRRLLLRLPGLCGAAAGRRRALLPAAAAAKRALHLLRCCCCCCCCCSPRSRRLVARIQRRAQRPTGIRLHCSSFPFRQRTTVRHL
ncbi:hypothetical protein, conserved, partial [Eimeria tenella]